MLELVVSCILTSGLCKTTENEARLLCVHTVGVKQNRQNQRHESGDKWEWSQTTSHKECYYQGEE
jgi:hypothetical protein